MTLICVDAGTTVIKVVAYDQDGRERAIERRETVVRRPRPGFAEQDMTEVWDAVVAGIRAVAAQIGEPITGLALTAQGDGCWLVDGDGNPTGPAILWNDGRAGELVAGWRESGVLDEAFRISGCGGFAGLPNAILTWLAEHEPARVENTAAALTCGGWIFSRLTGETVVDESEAAAPWLDVQRREYSDRLLDLYGMPWAKRLLPTLRHDDQRVSPLDDRAANTLGLPAGIPVVLAPYDVASTAIGVGAVKAGSACVILGTTLCTEVVASEIDTNRSTVGLTIPLGVPGLHLRALPTLAGSEVLSWCARMLGFTGAAQLCEEAAAGTPGANGLSFLPYLSPAGERVPFLDERARGSLHGLSLEHSRTDVARAVVEGLTYVILDCLRATGTTPTELRVCGGGANSDAWCQLIADITGLPAYRSVDSEVGAKGAFLTGLVATGAVPDFPEAADRHVHVRDGFEPNGAVTETYQSLFIDFLADRDSAGEEWARHATVRAGLADR